MLSPNSKLRLLSAAAVTFGLIATATHAQEALPSWNDGPAKQAILEFVKATTTQGNPQFVPPEARVATFDQDGTLWVEHPMYTQVMYCLERVPTLVKSKPELAKVADRKSTRLNSSHSSISYAVFCLKKKKQKNNQN